MEQSEIITRLSSFPGEWDELLKEEKEKEYKRQWESFRDKRVKSWNRFKSKITNGKSKGKYEIKPPKNKIEERVD